MISYLCSDAVPNLLGLFDTTIAPTLMYYSYGGVICLSLFFSLFVFFKDRSLMSRSLLSLTIFFVLWVLNEILQWIAADARLVHFGWQLSGLLQLGIVYTVAYFSYLYLYRKPAPFWHLLVWLLFALPVLVLLSTPFNMNHFDMAECQSFNGPLWSYIYILQVAIGIYIFTLCSHAWHVANKEQKIERFYFSVGSILLIGAFIGTNIAGDATLVYEFNLIGPIGMVVFIGLLSFLIVRFKVFNIKLIGAQALVTSLAVLIFALLFVRNIENIRYVVIVTLLLTIILGRSLVRSVKREIEAKEKVEKLAAELEEANIQQESLIRFISHEMKGYLTTSAGLFASIVEGDFNPISDMLKSSAEMALAKVREGVRSVVEILSNANAKKGTLSYKMAPFDFGKVVLAGIAKLAPDAKEKGVVLETAIQDDGMYRVMGDTDQLSEHVVRNLIDNSIKYTPTGSIHIDLSKRDGKVLLSIKDTGVGITTEDKAHLFTEGGRGKNSLATNVHSTGYGLAIAKKIVDAHSGRIWVESEGQDKGSQFYVELPEAK
ncbi:MAG: hypothetical protein COV01_02365 [Candidatus Taylorbacteria bacterium CG10_big_fil_rev_8_21_14_0_10_41_48]|uniref:histidine kinase n=1 Tax=Candidatus Taylorbacteria bacterium CG10_big_fil_rev_8_21_14_0_10_41_48 TaxID=1975024 RepID=A0A2M8LCG4_9BACT|nr:MAG: hypothetical protein COV01_02365 [Candidatus Taylorbacteria bacterium CG10_big_fil_rev_8_21_14_0_10_41_48]